MGGSAGWVGGAGLLLLAGCGLPDVDLEGAHVRLAMESGLTPCGDATGHMDRFVELVAAELGVSPPTGDDRVVYYWLHAGDFAARNLCGEGAAGCADSDTIYANSFPIDHELVHSLTARFGSMPLFFAEGLAVAYQLPAPGYEDDAALADISIAEAIEAREGTHLEYELYALAGAFVAFLIEREGVDAAVGAISEMGWLNSSSAVSDVLAAELGASLDELAAEFEATRRRCSPSGYRRKLFECSAPEIAWDGALWAGHRTMDCDMDDVIGPFASDTLASYRTITVPADAMYELTVIGDSAPGSGQSANAVTLLRCGGCDGHIEETISAGEASVRLPLTAGRYSLRFTGPVGAASGVGLRVERVEAP